MFEVICQKLVPALTFFRDSPIDAIGRKGASTLVKVLLPLKSLAFGVSQFAFSDFFQVQHIC